MAGIGIAQFDAEGCHGIPQQPRTIMIAVVRLAAIALVLSFGARPAWSQMEPTRPKTYALISAVGDQFAVVRDLQVTGTNRIDAFRRETVKVPDGSIDSAILRGMDSVLARREPNSKRIFLRLAPGQLDGVRPERREQVALERLRSELSKMPDRSNWDEIVLITPYFRLSEINGQPGKLQGVGIYFRNIDSNVDSVLDQILPGQMKSPGRQTVKPDGTPGEASSRYVGLFAYMHVWFLDAKTLQVLQSEPWVQEEKVFDKEAAGLDIATMMPLDQLAARFENFTEQAASRAVGATRPVVEPGELRLVGPTPSSDGTKP
ncbi:MAG: hypothetical protein ACK54C_10050 [Betaproteobacteria bacterium]